MLLFERSDSVSPTTSVRLDAVRTRHSAMLGIHCHFLLSLLSLVAVPISTSAAPLANITKRAPAWGFPYGSQKVRGVNLGGWLLLEVCLITDGGELPRFSSSCLVLHHALPLRQYQ
jgi:hypothetical protein